MKTPKSPKSIVYYVSSHGLGHSARTAAICRNIPSEVPLIIRSKSPVWFNQGHLDRPFEWIHGEFDSGAVQKNSIDVDERATLEQYAKVEVRNREFEREEIAFLRERKAAVVCSDIPSYPMALAQSAGIPGVLVANFTWSAIYREYLAQLPQAERSKYEDMICKIESEYHSATLVLRPPLFIAMPELDESRVVDIAHVVRPFVELREKLMSAFNVPAGKTLALLSIGAWGIPLAWRRLVEMDSIVFFSFDAPPMEGLITLPKDEWRSQDVTASVDVVISKAGYGTVTECMAGGTPLIFPPRKNFAEQAALETGIKVWGGGISVSEEEFFSLNIENAIDCAISMNKPEGFRLPMVAAPMNGGRIVAEKILGLIGEFP